MPIFRFPKRKIRKLIQQGEYADALALGRSLEPRLGDDPDFLFIMGTIYYIVEDAPKALEYFGRCLKIKPDDVETLYLKADVHLHLGEHDIALEHCKRILQLDPDHQQARQITDFLDS